MAPVAEKVPGMQPTQIDDDAAPEPEPKEPEGHAVQLAMPVAAAKLPLAQPAHEAAPLAENMPRPHFTHDAEEKTADAPENNPASHAVQLLVLRLAP